MVLPLLILFLFGIIDVGRYMWTLNQVEKATQMGARMAVVTNMVPGGLAAQNYGSDPRPGRVDSNIVVWCGIMLEPGRHPDMHLRDQSLSHSDTGRQHGLYCDRHSDESDCRERESARRDH